MDTDAPLLVVDNLSIIANAGHANEAQLVDSVSFSVRPGQVLGLIGESGAGKSTIGLASLGFLRPGCTISGGNIRLGGRSVFSHKDIRGRAITYVPQSASASMNPAFRLIDQVCEAAIRKGLLNRREAEAYAQELFAKLGLTAPRFGLRYPHQVSGGQLQRTATAMALCTHPQIVVFDEPTTALDVTVQLEVLRLIRDTIREAGLAALYISHDLPVVAQIADDIMVLRYGKMVEFGSVRDVIERPREDYSKRLVSVQLAARVEHSVPATQPILSCEAIRAGYGPVEIIKGVSVSLDVGRTLAIVGESGSGKSSLARVLTGLLPPALGSVKLEGVELSPGMKGRTLDTRRQMQFIYQNPDVALNPRLRVRSILARPLQLYFELRGSALRDRLTELMEQMEMSRDLLDRLPGELSGGQKQRVCIARALAARPKLIICDEITSALDPLVADGIGKLLKRIQEDTGISYLVITHDMAFVKSMSDHVAVMRNGEMVECGTTEDVLIDPQNEYTKKLIRSVPRLEVNWLTTMLFPSETERR